MRTILGNQFDIPSSVEDELKMSRVAYWIVVRRYEDVCSSYRLSDSLAWFGQLVHHLDPGSRLRRRFARQLVEVFRGSKASNHRMPGGFSSTIVRTRASLLLMCLVALGLRLAVVLLCSGSGLYSDMFEYHDRAALLVRHGFANGMYAFDAWRSPGYPLFVWATSTVGAADLSLTRFTQAALGAVITGLTYALARNAVGRRAALAAALVVAIYPAFTLFALYLASETLFTALMLAGLCLWFRPDRPSASAAGLLFGAATLTRAAGIAGEPAVLAAAWLSRSLSSPPRLGSRLTLMLAAYALVFVPWVVRNAQIYDQFIPIDTNGGFNFLVGNNPEATGRFEWGDQVRLPATYYPNAKSDAEIAAIGVREGLAYVWGHPARTARLALAKVGYLAGLEGREHVWLYSQQYFGVRSALTVWAWGTALLVAFPLLMVPAVFGLMKPGVLATPVGVFIVVLLAVSAALHIASFGEARFHLPLVPFLAILAARMLDRSSAVTFMQWSRWRHVTVAMLLIGLAWTWQSQLPLLLDRLTQMATAVGAPPALIY